MRIDHTDQSSAPLFTTTVDTEVKRAALTRLRTRLAHADMPAAATDDEWLIGVPALDEAITALSLSAVHEVVAGDAREDGAAAGFVVALAARRMRVMEADRRPLLWVTRRDRLYTAGALSGRGLADFGVDPASVLLAAGRTDADVLWAMEEALRSNAVALAVGEVEGANLVATRRLSLAAREQGTPALLFRPARSLGPSAARTRWRLAAAPSRPPHFAANAPRRACWRVTLEKGWVDHPRSWIVEWDDEARCFHLVTAMADHTDRSRTEEAVTAFRRAG